jgi:sugar phosphate permease
VPTLRDEYALSLGEIGVLLASERVGTTLALLPWGLAADRFGERIVLSVGLTASAAFIVGAAFAESFGALLALLALAGAAGASVNSSSGRAVLHWFDERERGLALGVRQTAIPVGGLVGALALPSLVDAGGIAAAFLFLGSLCAVGALVGALILRGRAVEDGMEPESIARTLADRGCGGSPPAAVSTSTRRSPYSDSACSSSWTSTASPSGRRRSCSPEARCSGPSSASAAAAGRIG